MLTSEGATDGAAFETRYSMSKLWCVKGDRLNDGEMFVSADSVEISPHGELASTVRTARAP
jgi:hypothetical protein